MIYDMRIYDVQPGAVPRYMEAAREVARKIREDHGVKLPRLNLSSTGCTWIPPPEESAR